MSPYEKEQQQLQQQIREQEEHEVKQRKDAMDRNDGKQLVRKESTSLMFKPDLVSKQTSISFSAEALARYPSLQCVDSACWWKELAKDPNTALDSGDAIRGIFNSKDTVSESNTSNSKLLSSVTEDDTVLVKPSLLNQLSSMTLGGCSFGGLTTSTSTMFAVMKDLDKNPHLDVDIDSVTKRLTNGKDPLIDEDDEDCKQAPHVEPPVQDHYAAVARPSVLSRMGSMTLGDSTFWGMPPKSRHPGLTQAAPEVSSSYGYERNAMQESSAGEKFCATDKSGSPLGKRDRFGQMADGSKDAFVAKLERVATASEENYDEHKRRMVNVFGEMRTAPHDLASPVPVQSRDHMPSSTRREPVVSFSTSSSSSSSLRSSGGSLISSYSSFDTGLDEKIFRSSLTERNSHGTYVKRYFELTDKDVLCGRGGRTNHHPGNKMYLEEKDALQERYRASSNTEEKKMFCNMLIQTVRGWGGKFLKLDESACEKKWYEVPYHEAYKKVSQALREVSTPESRAAKRRRYKNKANGQQRPSYFNDLYQQYDYPNFSDLDNDQYCSRTNY